MGNVFQNLTGEKMKRALPCKNKKTTSSEQKMSDLVE